jgi:hypothetical protein
MRDVVLIKENSSLDKLVDSAAGSFATLSSALVGGISLYMLDNSHWEALPNLAVVTPALYLAGQYFFTPCSEKVRV